MDSKKGIGFLFIRESKKDGKKFVTGHIEHCGEKLEIIAHFANKVDKNGNKFMYVFEREILEDDKNKKKPVTKKNVDTDSPF